MDFEQLKKGWQQQHKPTLLLQPEERESLLKRIRAVRRRYLLQNIFISACFALVLGVVGWIWVSFASRGLLFHLSLAGMVLLMLVTLTVLWLKTSYWERYDFSSNTVQFLEHLISKLRFTRWTTRRLSPLYTFLLWVVLFFYMLDVGQQFSWQTQLLLHLAVLAWALFSLWWGMRREKKKEAQHLEPLLKELEALKKKLEE